MTRPADPLCACTHARDAHEHLRRGLDCSTCECPAFRPRLRDLARNLYARLLESPVKIAHAVGLGAALAVALIGTAITATSVASAQAEVLVTNLDAKGWEFKSETTTSGHVEFALNGVQLKTDDNAGKAAGFVDVSGATLKDVAGANQEPSLRYNAQTGTGPAFQLELSSPTKGWIRLINDPAVNGNKWWATKTCPSCAGLKTAGLIEDGSTNAAGAFQATLDAWDKAVPDAKVTKIGFALGTGGPLKGVLSQVKFLGTTYRFAVATVVTTPPTAISTTSALPTTTSTTTPPPADGPEYATCAEASAAGIFDIPATDPNYRADMDSDSDGTACERADSDGFSQVGEPPVGAVETGGGPA